MTGFLTLITIVFTVVVAAEQTYQAVIDGRVPAIFASLGYLLVPALVSTWNVYAGVVVAILGVFASGLITLHLNQERDRARAARSRAAFDAYWERTGRPSLERPDLGGSSTLDRGPRVHSPRNAILAPIVHITVPPNRR